VSLPLSGLLRGPGTAPGKVGNGMFPLDRNLLLFLKFFVVLTCFFFWIRLIYLAIQRQHRIYSRHLEDEEE
jgi:hypothetical protein